MSPEPEAAKAVLGVVVEVALPKGLDLVAGYADHSARYFNFSGAAVVWDHPDSRLDGDVDALLDAGCSIAKHAGHWDGPRPTPPQQGQARINLLTPGGLIFGQGPMADLARDPLGGRALTAATSLMQKLIDLRSPGEPS